MKTKKTFPVLLSILAIASIASTAALGNVQTAYAGNGCFVDPVSADLGPVSDGLPVIPKTIQCLEDVTNVVIDTSDCDANNIDVEFDNISIDTFGVWTADEIVGHSSPIFDIELHCTVTFDVTHLQGGDFLMQTIWLIAEPFPPIPGPPVGGKFLTVNNSALLIAGLSANLGLIVPIAAGIAGVGAYYIRSRMNKD